MRARPMTIRPVLATLVGIALLVGTVAGAAAQTNPPQSASPAAGVSLATPEEAVAAYLTALAAGDVDALLAATAVDEMATGFDLVAYVDRLRAFDVANAL